MHSALKKDGKALYEYAREGIEIERAPRDVVIHALKVTQAAAEGQRDPIVASVSKGTYIRTLGEDIGEALGCGAHLTSLRRTATGNFGVAQCITLEALEAMDEEERLAQFLPAESLVDGHSRVTLGAEDAARFLSGLRRRGAWPDATRWPCSATRAAGLPGHGHIAANELIPGRLLNPIEIQQILLNAQQTEATP
jgi:tRNA pseudouridine55 synthase